MKFTKQKTTLLDYWKKKQSLTMCKKLPISSCGFKKKKKTKILRWNNRGWNNRGSTVLESDFIKPYKKISITYHIAVGKLLLTFLSTIDWNNTNQQYLVIKERGDSIKSQYRTTDVLSNGHPSFWWPIELIVFYERRTFM